MTASVRVRTLIIAAIVRVRTLIMTVIVKVQALIIPLHVLYLLQQNKQITYNYCFTTSFKFLIALSYFISFNLKTTP